MNASHKESLTERFMLAFAHEAQSYCRDTRTSGCDFWKYEQSIYACVSRFPEFVQPKNRSASLLFFHLSHSHSLILQKGLHPALQSGPRDADGARRSRAEAPAPAAARTPRPQLSVRTE